MMKRRSFPVGLVILFFGIIGIAYTIYCLNASTIEEVIYNRRHAKVIAEITKATNAMKKDGVLREFKSTDDFVNVLSKYLKIKKRCFADNIAECWPTNKITMSDSKDFPVKNAKTRFNLSFMDYQDNKNAGLVLADGTCIIMTYNPGYMGVAKDAPIHSHKTELYDSERKHKNVYETDNTTSGISFVMDVNGKLGPNSETSLSDNKKHDIRSFNGAYFKEGMPEVSRLKPKHKLSENRRRGIGMYYVLVDDVTPLDCSKKGDSFNVSQNEKYCGEYGQFKQDYWAGARKACDDRGLKLPNEIQICDVLWSNYDVLDPNVPYWANNLFLPFDGDQGRFAHLTDNNKMCFQHQADRQNNSQKTICIK